MNKEFIDLEAEREGIAIQTLQKISHTVNRKRGRRRIRVGNRFDTSSVSYDKVWKHLVKEAIKAEGKRPIKDYLNVW